MSEVDDLVLVAGNCRIEWLQSKVGIVIRRFDRWMDIKNGWKLASEKATDGDDNRECRRIG